MITSLTFGRSRVASTLGMLVSILLGGFGASQLSAATFSMFFESQSANDVHLSFNGEMDTRSGGFTINSWASELSSSVTCKRFLSLYLDGADELSGTADDARVTFVARRMGSGLGLTEVNGTTQATTDGYLRTANVRDGFELSSGLGSQWFLVSEEPIKDMPWAVGDEHREALQDADFHIVIGANSTGTTAKGSGYIDRLPAFQTTCEGTTTIEKLGIERECAAHLLVPFAPIPEPSSALLGLTALGLAARRRRMAA